MGPTNGVDVGARRLAGPDKVCSIGWRRTGSVDEYAATNVNYGVSAQMGQFYVAVYIAAPLNPGMHGTGIEYLNGDARDFFYVSRP